jgi:sugar porter (SP) family MFS transporter
LEGKLIFKKKQKKIYNSAADLCRRFIAGLGLGAATMITPCYVSENAPRGLRGAFTGLYQFFETTGAMLAFWIDFGALLHIQGQASWIVPISMQALPPVLLSIGMLFCDESPRFLAKEDNWEKASKVLSRVRGLPLQHAYVQAELHEMQAQLAAERELVAGSTWWDMQKEAWLIPANRKRTILSISLMICQQMTGTNAINYYAPVIFTALGIGGTANSLFATGVYGICKVFGCGFFLLFLADSVGRRKSLMWSGVSMAIAMFYIGFYVRFDPPAANAPVPPAGYVALVAVYLFAVCFQLGWGPVCWIYVSEIPTTRLRGYNVSLAAATQWLFNFVVARSTPVMLITVGHAGYGTYFIFGCFCWTMVVLVYFFCPETKGISLERMDQLFGAADFKDVEELGAAAQHAHDTKDVQIEEVERV